MDISEMRVTFRRVCLSFGLFSGFNLQSSDYSHLETLSSGLPLD